MNIRWLALACLLAVLLLAACGDADKQAKIAVLEAINLELTLVPTGQPGQTLAVVRLFSRSLTQKELDQRLLPADKRQKIEPLKFKAGAKLWVDSMSFELRSPKDQPSHLKPGKDGKLKALSHPGAEELSLAPASAVQAVYLITAPGELQPGGKLRAALKVYQKQIVTPYRKIAQAPADPGQTALQKARAARWTDDAQAMLQAGKELSASDPASPAGPWYQGLAQERLGDKAAALSSYQKAMDLWRQKAKNLKHAEPPLGLARRISRLQKTNN